MNKMLRSRKLIILFMAPAMLFYVLLLLVPIVRSVYYSFFEGVVGIRLDFVGWKNYNYIFHDKDFWASFFITVKYIITVCTSQIILGLVIALVLFLFIRRHIAAIRTIVFLPMIIPTVAFAQLFNKVYEITPQYGLINSILTSVGLESAVQPWLGTSKTALWALCIADIWKSAGFYSIVFYAALVDISHEYIDAARIDGANNTKIISRILLPLIRSYIVAMTVFSLTSALKVFETPYVMTNGGPGNATRVLSLLMYDSAFTYSKYGYGSAIAVIMLALSLIVSIVTMRFDRPVE